MIAYKKIFSAAWNLTRHNPVLWLLAFAVAFIGTSGEVGVFLSTPSLGVNTPDESLGQLILGAVRQSGFLSSEMMRLVAGAVVQSPLLFLMFLVVVTLIAMALVGLVWLIIVFQGALIAAIYQLLDKKQPSLRGSVTRGIKCFWRVLGLNVLAGVVATIVFGVLRVLAPIQFVGSGLVFGVAFIALIMVLISIVFAVKFALIDVVMHDHSISAAWRTGVELFRRNWLISVETAIFLFLIYVIVTTLVSYVSYLALTTIIQFASSIPSATDLLVIISFLVLVAMEVVLTAFFWVAWIMVFEILNSPTIRFQSWLERTLGRSGK